MQDDGLKTLLVLRKMQSMLEWLQTKAVLLLVNFTTQSRISTTQRKKLRTNIVGKGENASNQQFLFFIRPSKTGRIKGSPVAGGRVGGVQFFVRSISPKLL